jgi:hypothetical protein
VRAAEKLLCVTADTKPAWPNVDQDIIADSNFRSTRGVPAPASAPYIVVGALGQGPQNAEDQYAHASLSTMMYFINDNASRSRRQKHDYVSGGVMDSDKKDYCPRLCDGARMNGCPVD